MQPNPFLGVVLHAIGGLAAGSFYIPFKKVKNWSWESYWLVNGFFSWIIAPWVAVFITCPDILEVLRSAPTGALIRCYGFGVLWGIGGLTFGLSMRYLGMSLGYALSLGFCAAFGTIIPPFFQGTGNDLIATLSGQITLVGVLVCLVGISVCGKAGMLKEAETSSEEKSSSISEFSFVKGVWVAIFAGVMSACMAFAFAVGKPIADAAVAVNTPDLFKNFPILVVALAGGFTTNFIWCVVLNIRNRSWGNYLDAKGASLLGNYIFSSLAGLTWYFQFFFYGMGSTKMGKYDYTSWTIHMAFIIIFSNLWGLYFNEWKGSGRKTIRTVITGLLILLASTIIVGVGNYVAKGQ